jgi:glycosyltransferase involved in cell wall biosynthesis
MPARAARGLPVVLTVHDALPWTNPEWFTRANALQQRLLVTGAARRARRVITVSEEARRQLIAHIGIDGDRIDVVHNGISGRFGPEHRDRHWLHQRFGVSGPAVLVVGTREPRKNLPGAIAAFAEVHRVLPEARLIIAGGDGWGLPHLDAVLRPLGSAAVATGRLSDADLVRLYASGDCLLFPSFAEGFGLPPVEAMASGIPVVCSNRSSLPEVVGEAAHLCDPDDREALADAVVEVLTDAALAERMRGLGLARSAEFTWRRAAEQTLASYRSALRG